MRRPLRALALASPVLLILGWGVFHGLDEATADQPPRPDEEAESKRIEGSTGWTTAVPPKPQTEHVRKGLAWLAEHQLPSGGWGQGEESANMAVVEAYRDKSDVADTCIAALAFVRSGSTPRVGPYKDAVAKAVGFVREQVESSDKDSLAVSNIQGTRVQMKLGPNIDTFLASLLLAEVKGKMADDPGNAAVDLALNKVLDKLKKHQKADGSWDNQRGWAPILAQSVGGKGLNRARQAGAAVADELLAKTETYAKAQFTQSVANSAKPAEATVALAANEPAPSTRSSAYPGAGRAGMVGGMGGGMGGGRTAAGPGAAGVELYDRAASVGVLQESVNTNATREEALRKTAETGKDQDARDGARVELSRIGDAKKVNNEAQAALLGRLDDAQFVTGFGSNGGEEFLSYMNISESLVVKGGADWKRWDDAMTGNLNRIQNEDGSWSGHHCITGRTFCTSTALLVLMADRTPVPVATAAEVK